MRKEDDTSEYPIFDRAGRPARLNKRSQRKLPLLPFPRERVLAALLAGSVIFNMILLLHIGTQCL